MAAPAIEYAEQRVSACVRAPRGRSRSSCRSSKRWPGNKQYWLKPDGSLYRAGETIKLPTLRRTLQRMVEAERAAKASGRAAGIVAARDRFYKGDIAREMVAFLQQARRAVRRERLRRVLRASRGAGEDDLSRLHHLQARVRQPGTRCCSQTLNILEQFDLQAMGYGSADYLHTIIEAMKLAYADRDTYYADPAFVHVPAEGLLSKAYAQRARGADRSAPRLHERSSRAIRCRSTRR